jgi:hypothetical protein
MKLKPTVAVVLTAMQCLYTGCGGAEKSISAETTASTAATTEQEESLEITGRAEYTEEGESTEEGTATESEVPVEVVQNEATEFPETDSPTELFLDTAEYLVAPAQEIEEICKETETETEAEPLPEYIPRDESDYSYVYSVDKIVYDYWDMYASYWADEDYLYFDNGFVISWRDFILLCNCTAWEYGFNYVPCYERSLVVEVVMNRLYSPYYGSSIYEVVTASGQFTGSGNYADLDTYLPQVTDDVINAVCICLGNYDNPDYYNEGYMYFYGDGIWNYFSQQWHGL